MKSKAILMALAMMTTALAGCTSGTDGVPEMDEDALNELIQDNLQDFICLLYTSPSPRDA